MLHHKFEAVKVHAEEGEVLIKNSFHDQHSLTENESIKRFQLPDEMNKNACFISSFLINMLVP